MPYKKTIVEPNECRKDKLFFYRDCYRERWERYAQNAGLGSLLVGLGFTITVIEENKKFLNQQADFKEKEAYYHVKTGLDFCLACGVGFIRANELQHESFNFKWAIMMPVFIFQKYGAYKFRKYGMSQMQKMIDDIEKSPNNQSALVELQDEVKICKQALEFQ